MRFTTRQKDPKLRGFAHADGLVIAFIFGILAAIVLAITSRHDSTWLKVIGWLFVGIAALGAIRDLIVFGRIARKRKQNRQKQTVSMTHGTTYKWKKGICLRALQDVELMFPGILLAGPEKCGEVMEVSDPKTEVGFFRNSNGEGFESINVRLKANCSLRLQKDSETVITFDSVSPALFRVEGS